MDCPSCKGENPDGARLCMSCGNSLANLCPECGTELPGQIHSRVIELNPETKETVWEYRGAPPMTFFSSHVSGCHRLENGNTLICEGLLGRIFEVTPDGDIVWEYVSPIFHDHPAGYKISQMFRAFRYAADSPEIAGRVKLLD